MTSDKLKVLLFCGGRGSKTLINELLRRTDVELTLIVNAYDDGLSTGALRKFIPGMLGPSDFRKNLSYLLNLYSTEQYALQKLLEYRLPLDFSEPDLAIFRKYVSEGNFKILHDPLRSLFKELEAAKAEMIRKHLHSFFIYYDRHKDVEPFAFTDCSVGNLAFAGIYLNAGQNFNQTIEDFGLLTDTQARLINISKGEGYTLVGIKLDGQLLISEGSIVDKQSAVPILDTFFVSAPPTAGWASLQEKSTEEKIAWLKQHEMHPQTSKEAAQALALADVIIYGAGTQHSSLLPSYRIAHAAIMASPAKIKAFVVNLGHDYDIQGLNASALVDTALHYLHDDENKEKVITHILYHSTPPLEDSVLFDDAILAHGVYKNAKIVSGSYANPVKQNAHNGFATVTAALDLVEECTLGDKPALDLYLDLLKRSAASNSVLQEASELRWDTQFSSVTIHVPEHFMADIPPLPPYLRVVPFSGDRAFWESAALFNWVTGDKKVNYLATLTGDGEYRLKDLLMAVNLLKTTSFAALLGSRTQSRRQFLKSLRSAYGEGGLLYRLSWMGAFVLTALFGLRFGIVFSDPLTGFRVYRRDRFPETIGRMLQSKKKLTSVAIIRYLLMANVEIAEIPVNYKTFSGFTSPGWRFYRGLKSLFSFFG